ncbi:MAG: hypothetical protein ACD_3C00023G0002 [uncultured bacterium (gcode 4)]|uniref:Uncharacterized protein n=1 Tax=uncultured bacterium (gcode 4) TaxID=1234023 RepID=K2G367_9BACT|nr:MAG: hypothetical protein ACD_3C00023G0002 [uncultured bacterium (gcode 4)]
MISKNNKSSYSRCSILNSAFTLVELIVVIVILAILATIAFLSFSSQSASARDSTRLADMSNIDKWLKVFNATAGKYPAPDEPISITASWILIWTQWFAWRSLLSNIKLSDWWKDPLDNSSYYTYSTNPNQSKFQLLWFLEDWNNSALSLLPPRPANGGEGWGEGRVNANPSSYSWRYAITKWDMLWIILHATTSLPAQISNASIDLISANGSTNYKAVFGNENSSNNITASWSEIFSNILNRRSEILSNTQLSQLDDSLIGFWDFEEWFGTVAKDKSKSWNHGAFTGTVHPTWIKWKNSWAIAINWFWWVDIWNISWFTWYTQVAVFKYDNTEVPYIYILQTGLWDIETNSWYLDFFSWDSRNWWTENTRRNHYSYKLKPGEWYNVAVVAKDLTKADLYINWEYVATTNVDVNPGWTYFWSSIWYNEEIGRNLYWAIDEVRVYKRPLSPSEIWALYQSTR